MSRCIWKPHNIDSDHLGPYINQHNDIECGLPIEEDLENNVSDTDKCMLDSFKTLIKMYSDHANEDGTNKTISMGGFQQFLNKKLTRSNQNQDSLTDIQQLRKGCETDQATVFDLPVSVKFRPAQWLTFDLNIGQKSLIKSSIKKSADFFGT